MFSVIIIITGLSNLPVHFVSHIITFINENDDHMQLQYMPIKMALFTT